MKISFVGEFSRIIHGKIIKFPTQKQLRLLGGRDAVQCRYLYTFVLRTKYTRTNGAVLMDTIKTTKIDRNATGRKLGLNDREVIQTKQNVKRRTCGCPCLIQFHLLKQESGAGAQDTADRKFITKN